MNLKTVKTFKDISRRSSIYMIFDNAAAKNNLLKLKQLEKEKEKEKENFKSLPEEKSVSLSSKSYSSSNSKVTSSKKDISASISGSKLAPSKNENKLIQKILESESEHIYNQNRLPILTNSQTVLNEMKNISQKDDYYKRFVSENNFGKKFCKLNPAYEDYSKNTREDNLLKMGLNNEESNPLDLLDKKNKRAFSIKSIKTYGNSNKYNFLDYPFLKMLKNKNNKNKNNKINKSQNKQILKLKENDNNIDNNNDEGKDNDNINPMSSHNLNTFSFAKKDEFSNYLIMEYIKNNFPSILTTNNNKDNNIDNNSNNNKNPIRENRKYILKFLEEKIETRKIYVIKDSTVISNPRIIPGFVIEIPSINYLKKLKKPQKFYIYKRFLKFISIKFRAKHNFCYIFDKTGNLILDLAQISENDKYVFVSSINYFQGISLSVYKGLIELYIKYFGQNKKKYYYFEESSIDESSKISENNKKNYLNNTDEIDDVYDIFFSKGLNLNKMKDFKKRKKQISKQTSFTFGINDNEENNYEYLYYSDNEIRKKNLFNHIFKNCKNKIDFYLQSKNTIYDKTLKELELKLSENKAKNKNKQKKETININSLSADMLLREEYLTEKKLKNRYLFKTKKENKPLTNQNIIDAFNLLQRNDPSMDINKFCIQKKLKKNLPYVRQNIKDNTDKYPSNHRKTNKIYPSLFNINIPGLLKSHPKYTLHELIKYYTKFKSLINIWFNLYNNVNVVDYGIDFDTFYNCSDELSNEEIEFVKMIYEKINDSPSGILSLEDYIEALNCINQKDSIHQFNLFTKIFLNKDKKILYYKDVLDIAIISIKRIVKRNDTNHDQNIIKDLAKFLANYIFKICNVDVNKGIEVNRLKIMLNSIEGENLDYLKMFLCFRDEK